MNLIHGPLVKAIGWFQETMAMIETMAMMVTIAIGIMLIGCLIVEAMR